MPHSTYSGHPVDKAFCSLAPTAPSPSRRVQVPPVLPPHLAPSAHPFPLSPSLPCLPCSALPYSALSLCTAVPNLTLRHLPRPCVHPVNEPFDYIISCAAPDSIHFDTIVRCCGLAAFNWPTTSSSPRPFTCPSTSRDSASVANEPRPPVCLASRRLHSTPLPPPAVRVTTLVAERICDRIVL